MSKKKPLTQEQQAECRAAHELYLLKKNKLGLSQKKIGDAAGITAPAVNFYFKGINPLNVQFALILSRMLDEPVGRFSPRLAKEISRIAGVAGPSSTPGEVADPYSQLIIIECQRASAEQRRVALGILNGTIHLHAAQAPAASHGATVADIYDDLKLDLDAYWSEPDVRKKLEISDKIVSFIDRRKRDDGVPAGVKKDRRSGLQQDQEAAG